MGLEMGIESDSLLFIRATRMHAADRQLGLGWALSTSTLLQTSAAFIRAQPAKPIWLIINYGQGIESWQKLIPRLVVIWN